MTEFVCRRTGRTYRVGEQLDQHGHAVVHAVEPASSNLALKQYLPVTLQKRPDLEARIQAMIAHPPDYRADRSGHVSCAWPEDAAYISGRFAGFVMPRVHTEDAFTIHDVATSRDRTWRERVTVAENLARAVALLHASDVVIGDFPERNLLAWSDGHVTLLGCDRMQVADPRSLRRFPCLATSVGTTPSEQPPELVHASLWSTLRTSSSDIFPLAVELHLLLLQGEHPFGGEWTGHERRPAERVLAQDGLWSYAGDPRLGPHPDAVPLTVLPETLQRYFRAAFVDGARNPHARPPAQEWLTALVRLREALVTCAREPSHVYGHHLPSCPWCPPGAQSPYRADNSIASRYTRPQRSPRVSATATATLPNPAPTLPADGDITPAGTDPTPPALLTGRRPPHTPPPRPAPSRRHRSALRVAAWAAVAVVGIGGAIWVASATDRPAPAVTGPAAPASTRTASTPASRAPRPADPTEALQQVGTQDAPIVETLAESWVAQLSARPAGTKTADGTTTDAAILAGHDALRTQYPGALLVWSPDWNYDGRFWITVVNQRFSTGEEANAWCDTHGFAPRECFAKRLSHSGAVEGSAKYRE
jgi:DNA-binding helix-hairpin-helix protein with protein kinase domain